MSSVADLLKRKNIPQELQSVALMHLQVRRRADPQVTVRMPHESAEQRDDALQHCDCVTMSHETSEQRDDALQHCPPFVRTQILKHLYRTNMKDCYLFQECDNTFIDQ
eukprot:6386065-Pyramimonas_sp.AAC.1